MANSREVVVIFGSLTTCDPGNIHDTMHALAKNNIRVSMVCLAAELKVCKDICKKTHGKFGVALDEAHFRDLLFEHINPPEVETSERKNHRARADEEEPIEEGVDLMQMGFPTRLPTSSVPTMCACHNRLKSGGYLCPRCLVKVCDVPTDCPVCGLTIVMSTHLARSYHHLFPVANYTAIRWEALIEQIHGADSSTVEPRCFGCASKFDAVPLQYLDRQTNDEEDVPANVAPSGRYRCPRCEHDYCLECDSFVHENLHQCPGCR